MVDFAQDQNAQENQKQRLNQVQQSLQKFNVELTLQFSTTLHDREIRYLQVNTDVSIAGAAVPAEIEC